MKEIKSLSLLLFALLFSLASCKPKTEQNSQTNTENCLSKDEINKGWKLLFDGKTMDEWRSFHSDSISGWTIEDHCLTGLGAGADLTGDIISRDSFSNFELSIEWKISEAGNSGIMFHVLEDGHSTTYETGPEYQLIDELNFPEHLEDWQKTGANYAMDPASADKILNPAGSFNSTRILVNKSHVEHWLNGKKIVEYELWSPEWKDKVAAGKWKDYPDYGLAETGHIALQDHGSKVWFKNIKIRPIE
ncbi:MAG: DUF1080 domain-containing protein [Bacteroidales bacterium]|nr:DUF1080 domain-containing protein [Bacteroidales bacterium]MCB8999873.1 DUF1080 domain-containing protein [Bacteroidales bacterium]